MQIYTTGGDVRCITPQIQIQYNANTNTNENRMQFSTTCVDMTILPSTAPNKYNMALHVNAKLAASEYTVVL